MKKTVLFFVFASLIMYSNVYSQNFWQTISDPSLSASTSAMIVAKNGNIIANANGWFRYSSNNGGSWNLASGVNATVNRLIMASNGDIYANASSLLKSVDNGMSWSTISSFQFNNTITDFAINTSGQIFAIKDGIIFKSANNGSSWDTLSKAFLNPAAISIAINSDNTIFIGTNSWATGGKIYRSTDNGINWSPMSGTAFASTSITLIKIAANNEIYIGTEGLGLSRSLDNGVTWKAINTGISGTNNWISDIEVNSSGVVFASVDYVGVFSSSNKGDSWSGISSGLQTSGTTVRTPTALAINSSGVLFAGTNGFGTYRSSSSTTGFADLVIGNILITNYPNPAKDNITFEVISKDALPKNLNLTLFNGSGKIVKQVSICSSVQNIKLNNLAQGFYSYILKRGTEIMKTGKIIIE